MAQDGIKQFVNPINGFREDSWWFYWEYLLNDDTGSIPNFVNTNEMMLKLFDRKIYARWRKVYILVELCKKMY